MDHTLPRLRFSIRQLVLATLVYAFLFAILAALRMPPFQILAASGVVTMFVVGDLLCGSSGRAAVPIHARAAHRVAKYASAFVLAMVVCLVVYLVAGAAPTAHSSSTAVSVLLSPVGFFAALSMIAFVAALQYYQTSVVYLFCNAPGVSLFGYMVYAAWQLGYLAG